MKIIDLLNKIANGEEVPKKIKYDNNIYKYIRMWEQYVDEVTEKPLLKGISYYNYSGLNNEVEILEEDKKIEKMSEFYAEHINENGEMTEIFNKHELAIIKKINEIIDYLKSKGE